MAINFPSSPADNTTYPKLPTVPGVAYTAKSNTWRNMTGRALPENRMMNPALQISQLNGLTDGTNITGVVLADEYYAYYTASTGSYRAQRVISPTPRGGQHRIRLTVTAADTSLAAGEWLVIRSQIEGSKMVDAQFGTAAARQIIIRFGIRAPAGTYNLNLRNNDFTRYYIATFTISAGQANTDTEQVIVIPGDITGTWDSGTAAWAWIYWVFCSANTTTAGNANKWVAGNFVAVSGITNGFGVVGNTFEIFDIGLYVDPYFTGLPPEWELPDHRIVLRQCQRYWTRIYGLRGPAYAPGGGERISMTLPVPMRIIPALAIRGAPQLYDGYASSAITGFTTNYSTVNTICVGVTGSGSVATTRGVCQYYTSDNDYISAAAWL